MINKTAFIVCILTPFVALSQTTQSGRLAYLEFSKGFNNIVLGQNFTLIPQNRLSYLDNNSALDSDSCKFYEYKDDDQFSLRSELNLESIAIRVYKNKVINIYLFYYRVEGFKILNKFLTLYGQFTDRPDNYADVYNWNCSSVSLSLRYQLNIDLGVAIFTDKNLDEELKDKKKRLSTQQQILLSSNN